MMTVKQVSSLTGVSARTLQFYDEIGLFKPTQVTDAGYRLYDESALEELQQILFFKELDFTLKEIKIIMDDPQFNKAAAFEKQRELIRIKRDRLNALLGLLDKLLKGEKCMEVKDFDMSEYFRVLADFKNTHTDEIVKQLGDMESFDRMVDGMKNRESEIAEMAVRQYGSCLLYTSYTRTQVLSSGIPILPPSSSPHWQSISAYFFTTSEPAVVWMPFSSNARYALSVIHIYVIQAYIKNEESAYAVPNHSLCAFVRIHLEPGESKRFELQVPPTAFTVVDEDGRRFVDSRRFLLYVGCLLYTSPPEQSA